MFMQMLVLGAGLIAAAMGFADSQAAEAKPIKMVVLGDSLSAGLGLSASAAFPERLQKALKSKGIDADIINAGVSGDTSSGGRDRLDWSVPEGTLAVLVELGANDALRGIDPAVVRANLEAMIAKIQASGAKLLLMGMRAPANFGDQYQREFERIYPELAHAHAVTL